MAKTRKKYKPVTKDNILFLCIGIALIAYSSWNIQQTYEAYLSKYWPGTSAVITETSIAAHTSGRYTNYEPVIYYSYKIPNSDNLYKSHITELPYGKDFPSAEQAETFLQEYDSNPSITIYYDPKHPERSVIKPGVKFEKLSAVIFPLIFGYSLFLQWQLSPVSLIGFYLNSLFEVISPCLNLFSNKI